MFQQILQSITVKILVAIINFTILILTSKYLGVSSRGEISIFLLNLAIIQGINEVFTGYSIIYFVPKYSFKKIVIYGLGFTAIFCSLSNLILVFLNKQVEGYEWLGFLVSVLVILNTFNSMLLLGKEAIRSFNALAFLQPFILLIGLIVCIFYGKQFTFISYLLPLFFSFLTAFLISSFLLFKHNKKKKTAILTFKLKKILSSGLYYQSAIVLFIFCNRFSFYLLSDNKKVGLYASACMLMESVLLIVNSIAPILVSKVANQNSQIISARYTLSFTKIAFISSVVMIILVYFIPETLITFFLGSGFFGVKQLMLLYSPAILFVSVFTIINHYFSGIGKQKFILVAYAIGFIVTISIAPYFIEHFDTKGAALIANLSYFSIFVVVLTLFKLNSNLKLNEFLYVRKDFNFIASLIKNEI